MKILSSHAHLGLKRDERYNEQGLIQLPNGLFRKGFSAHPEGEFDPQPNNHDSEIILGFDGRHYKTFRSYIGLDFEDVAKELGSVIFEVYTRPDEISEWTLKYNSGLFQWTDKPRMICVDIKNACQIKLRTTDGGDDMRGDTAVWASPVVE